MFHKSFKYHEVIPFMGATLVALVFFVTRKKQVRRKENERKQSFTIVFNRWFDVGDGNSARKGMGIQ
jgi:hypothetical protein